MSAWQGSAVPRQLLHTGHRCCWQAASQVGHTANDGGDTTSAIHCWPPSIRCARPHGLELRTTSAHSRTVSPLYSAWKPGFSLATSVLCALETSWQLHYINSHLPLSLPSQQALYWEVPGFRKGPGRTRTSILAKWLGTAWRIALVDQLLVGRFSKDKDPWERQTDERTNRRTWGQRSRLLFPQKTTIWPARIFSIGWYLGIFTRCLYCVIVFHFTISMYLLRTLHPRLHCTCMHVKWCHGLRLPDLNKETIYLLT